MKRNQDDDVFRMNPRPLTEEEVISIDALKALAEDLYEGINTASANGADERCVEVAKEKIEEAVMWAVKGITA